MFNFNELPVFQRDCTTLHPPKTTYETCHFSFLTYTNDNLLELSGLFWLFCRCEMAFIPGINSFGLETLFYVAELDLLTHCLDFCVYVHDKNSLEIPFPASPSQVFTNELRRMTSSVRITFFQKLLYLSSMFGQMIILY